MNNVASQTEQSLLDALSQLVQRDCATTAKMLRVIAEIDSRKLWAKHGYSSMFVMCTERFRMSEAVTSKRIWACRVACRFPRIFDMIERGDIHLSGVHQLAKHLTEDNHASVLRRAKHKSMREIEKLIAEIAPKPDVPSRVTTLPRAARRGQVVPLSPRRYKLEVTLSEEAHGALRELQALLSHQCPSGDPAIIVDHALNELLAKVRRQRAALAGRSRTKEKVKADRERATETCKADLDHANETAKRTRGIPAAVKRKVWTRDEGKCAFVSKSGRRCASAHFVEFHHLIPYACGGGNDADNVALRCRAHNQYEAELDFGKSFIHKRLVASRQLGNKRKDDPPSTPWFVQC